MTLEQARAAYLKLRAAHDAYVVEHGRSPKRGRRDLWSAYRRWEAMRRDVRSHETVVDTRGRLWT